MDDIGPGLKISWSVATVLSMIFELMTVVKATRERARERGGRVTSASLSVQPRPCPPQAMQLSIMAPGLALRGPEGSMTRAVMVRRGGAGRGGERWGGVGRCGEMWGRCGGEAAASSHPFLLSARPLARGDLSWTCPCSGQVMRGEYKSLHRYFYAGLFFFHISVQI